jgi:hypothetical protein
VDPVLEAATQRILAVAAEAQKQLRPDGGDRQGTPA